MCSDLEDIIAKCQKGDRRAGEQLYKMFSPKMFALCIQYSSGAMKRVYKKSIILLESSECERS